MIGPAFIRSFPLHPFLFSALFLLREFQETYRFVPVPELVLAGIAMVLMVAALIALTGLMTKNRNRAAIITSSLVIILLFYADIHGLFFSIDVFNRLVRRPYVVLFVTIALLFVILCWGIFRSRREFRRSNLYLNIIACALIVFQLGEINFLDRILETNYQHYLINGLETPPGDKSASKKPDIYYIVLDSYTSSRSLKDYWGYDNDIFMNWLANRGFFVANSSISPYTWTGFSIASTLNMSYLNTQIDRLPGGMRGLITHQLIKNSRVVGLLRDQGYQFINLSLFDMADTPRYYTYPEIMSGDSSFGVSLYNKTLLGIIKQRWVIPDFSRINLSIVETLKDMSPVNPKQPRFVYAHLMTPHWPYQFDRNGRITTGDKLRGQWKNKDKYLDQLIYTNQLIMDTLDTILSRYKSPPVIILQGDHGFRLLDGKDKDKEAHTILNAYLLPGAGPKGLRDSLTPVNSFRLIFNQCFGANFGLLEDAVDTSSVSITSSLPENLGAR